MLPEQGPEEIRKASRALNQMGGRVKRLIEDRTNMLAAISYDLRTPITRLRLRVEFLEDDALRSAMLKDLEQLNEMIGSALTFIRDSRVEGSMTRFNLPSLLQTISDQFVEMGERVSYHGFDRLPVTARADGIRRAVTNLVENALKFGTEAIIELRITRDGDITIDVLDDGPGILDNDPDKLVRPFVRGDDARISEWPEWVWSWADDRQVNCRGARRSAYLVQPTTTRVNGSPQVRSPMPIECDAGGELRIGSPHACKSIFATRKFWSFRGEFAHCFWRSVPYATVPPWNFEQIILRFFLSW